MKLNALLLIIGITLLLVSLAINSSELGYFSAGINASSILASFMQEDREEDI